MKHPHVELYLLIFQLDQSTLVDELVDYFPIGPSSCQESAHRLLPHRMHGGNAEQILFDVAGKSESVTFGGMLLIPKLRPRHLDGTGPKAIMLLTSLSIR
jgi:hypothetical protein